MVTLMVTMVTHKNDVCCSVSGALAMHKMPFHSGLGDKAAVQPIYLMEMKSGSLVMETWGDVHEGIPTKRLTDQPSDQMNDLHIIYVSFKAKKRANPLYSS